MSEQADSRTDILTEARQRELARAMDRLVGDHPEAQSVDEWFLIITLYASGLTGAENKFCKQYLVQKHRAKGEVYGARRLHPWVRMVKNLPKEGLMEKETIFEGRVVGINLPRLRGVAVDDPDFVLVSIEGKADYAIDVRLSVPTETARSFFAGQPVEVIVRLRDVAAAHV